MGSERIKEAVCIRSKARVCACDRIQIFITNVVKLIVFAVLGHSEGDVFGG